MQLIPLLAPAWAAAAWRGAAPKISIPVTDPEHILWSQEHRVTHRHPWGLTGAQQGHLHRAGMAASGHSSHLCSGWSDTLHPRRAQPGPIEPGLAGIVLVLAGGSGDAARAHTRGCTGMCRAPAPPAGLSVHLSIHPAAPTTPGPARILPGAVRALGQGGTAGA